MANWISAIASLVSLVVLMVVYIFAIGRRFGRLGHEQSALRQDLQARVEALRRDLQTWAEMTIGHIKGLQNMQGLTIGFLNARQSLTPDETSRLTEEYSKLATAGMETYLRRWRETANPLTREEADRLEHYINKARRGELFTGPEVEEYRSLVNRVEREYPADPGVWPLVALGAFLFGMWVASRAHRGRDE